MNRVLSRPGSESSFSSLTVSSQGLLDMKEEAAEINEPLDDLYSLCQIIDSRVAGGKNVLVHCQLGVSRSASLVIAYGLYKGFKTDFHSMYTSVKERSRWVGPNMSLIYQLMDFRAKVANGDYMTTSKPASPDWFLNASTE